MDAVQKQWFEETKLSWFERFLINVSAGCIKAVSEI